MRVLYKLLSSLFLGLSLLFFLSPVGLYWFIHGDDDRYVWIIKGPYPFSQFGSGPFQLWMGIGLVLTGVICAVISLVFSWLQKRQETRT
ncbi:hypothetical protein LCM20_09445 [Halobacillus litoralis]|uniref:hypothetical protein n=1 Tax=Halobacillus litoralis TaxID=45668 RepID=UPI001CD613D8|nr:hypothetical protein [Halobacillus litoralis]MCA0970813.1 hypothetical protein [Halobacillus litoralis]